MDYFFPAQSHTSFFQKSLNAAVQNHCWNFSKTLAVGRSSILIGMRPPSTWKNWWLHCESCTTIFWFPWLVQALQIYSVLQAVLYQIIIKTICAKWSKLRYIGAVGFYFVLVDWTGWQKFQLERPSGTLFAHTISKIGIPNSSRATRHFFGGLMPLAGLSHMAWGRSFFMSLQTLCDVWTKFQPLQNSRSIMYFLPGFSSLNGDVWAPQLKMARPKISK